MISNQIILSYFFSKLDDKGTVKGPLYIYTYYCPVQSLFNYFGNEIHLKMF